MTFYPVYEASNPLEQAASGVALKILTAQKKMGALKGINLKVMSLDDSRKERLKKAGMLVGAAIAGAALGAASGYGRSKFNGSKYEASMKEKVSNGVNWTKGTKVGKGVAGGYSKTKALLVKKLLQLKLVNSDKVQSSNTETLKVSQLISIMLPKAVTSPKVQLSNTEKLNHMHPSMGEQR